MDTDDSSSKRCNKCGEIKPLTDYSRLAQSRDGHNYRCRECESKRFQQYHSEHVPAAERGRQERKRFAAKLAARKKPCTKCGTVKPFGNFHKDARKRDGLYSCCKECWKELVYRRRKAEAATPVSYQAILEQYGMWCYICVRPIEMRAELQFDHVIPLAQGGPHSEENIRPTHARCNHRKGPRLLGDMDNGGRLF